MISGMQDHALALACLRHAVSASAVQTRGTDSLPAQTTTAVVGSRFRSLDVAELRPAFVVITAALLVEIAQADANLADRLAAPFRQLSEMDCAPNAPGC